MRKINNQDCEEASGGDLLTNRMFCALSDTARPCVGDSGSPLIFQGTLFGEFEYSLKFDLPFLDNMQHILFDSKTLVFSAVCFNYFKSISIVFHFDIRHVYRLWATLLTFTGVVSWSRSCDRQYPTAFTAIAELKDWITDITSISWFPVYSRS